MELLTRVLSVTEDVLLRWRLMFEGGRKKGKTLSDPDLLIAALAAQAGLIVVSRDTRHLVVAGVPAFYPWSWNLHAAGRVVAVADADGPDALAKMVDLMHHGRWHDGRHAPGQFRAAVENRPSIG